MFMCQLLVVMSLTFKVCKVSLIFTSISTINNIFVIVSLVGGCHGGCTDYIEKSWKLTHIG